MDTEFNLSDKTAIVSGGSRGIGYSTVQALLKEGMHVLATGRSEHNLDSLRGNLVNSERLHTCVCDQQDPEQVDFLFRFFQENFSRLDLLVNNAGIGIYSTIDNVSVDDWDQVMNTNGRGVFLLSRYAFKIMKAGNGGRIINISSVVGFAGNAGQVNYSAAKAGLVGLTKSVARELASRGITVNGVAPGYIETDMTAGLAEDITEKILGEITEYFMT